MASIRARYAEVVRLRQKLSRVQSELKFDQQPPSDTAVLRATSKDTDVGA
jgi:hypothetical protein